MPYRYPQTQAKPCKAKLTQSPIPHGQGQSYRLVLPSLFLVGRQESTLFELKPATKLGTFFIRIYRIAVLAPVVSLRKCTETRSGLSVAFGRFQPIILPYFPCNSLIFHSYFLFSLNNYLIFPFETCLFSFSLSFYNSYLFILFSCACTKKKNKQKKKRISRTGVFCSLIFHLNPMIL